MLLEKKKMFCGQNIRYVGKSFPGFIRNQPYMTFLAYQNGPEIRATYNGTEVTVSEDLTELIH